jgi:release factor glutamine methyltransferase
MSKTTRSWLLAAEKQLASTSVDTARLDALVLLEDMLGIDRTRILAEPAMEISTEQVARLEKLLKRRAGNEPLAYIRGHAEFYGREFVLTSAVLQPRPESEAMIDMLKQLAAGGELLAATTDSKRGSIKSSKKSTRALQLADVGTGSGALGITAKLELEPLVEMSVDLLEIDHEALKVAQINVEKYTTDLLAARVIQSDLLAQSSQDYDVLLCNLPYVPEKYIVNKSALWEPKIALFGGPDGLDLYRKLLQQIRKLPKRPLFILTESLPVQHEALQSIAKRCDYQLYKSGDFIQTYKRAG